MATIPDCSFLRAYVDCALFTSDDDDGRSLYRDFSAEDLPQETIDRMQADCVRFREQAGGLLSADNCLKDDWLGQAGHDFWLTRNGHGAGFWDGDWIEGPDRALTQLAQEFGEAELYTGDDGKIHHLPA